MTKRLEKLISIASPALSSLGPHIDDDQLTASGPLGAQLLDVLRRKNGFYAFESALHVLPAGDGEMDLRRWNAADLWRDAYGGMADGCLFFAEDVFGGQFCLKDDAIHTFDPETGGRERIAASIEQWAAAILDDYEVLTGFPLAHQWQVKHGRLPSGKRLIPKVPFVCGGKFTVDNLYLIDAVRGMRLRGELAVQIRDLPDGTPIRFKIVD